MEPTFYDCETSRFPDGNPYRSSSELISYAIGRGSETVFGFHTEADFTANLLLACSKVSFLVTINGKFDLGWARRMGASLPVSCRVWDCQLAEFYLSGQTKAFASMDELCGIYDIRGKEGGLEEYWGAGIETRDIPREIVQRYNLADIERTRAIYERQQTDPRLTPLLRKTILVGGADLLVLQQMEENGIKYDKGRSRKLGDETQQELREIDSSLQSYLPADILDFNWDSGDDLSSLIYGGPIVRDVYEQVERVYKSGARIGETYERNKLLETKRWDLPTIFKPIAKSEVKKSSDARKLYSVAEGILRQLRGGGKSGKTLINLLLRRSELAKLADTYYFKIPAMMEANEWGDFVHGNYNQCIARTGRLSSSKPNMQNNPEEIDGLYISRFD